MRSLLLAISFTFLGLPSVFFSQEAVYQLANEKKWILNLLYSESCPYSKKVLNYLKQIHRKIPCTEVKNNPQAKEYLKTHGGIMQVPCLFVDGKPIYGADEIIDWLELHKESLDPD